jgi:1-phosphofructokinase family hexose kinase
MLVTVTPNTGIDQTVFISQWQPGQAIRANRTVQSMAGKPTDAAFILGKLGLPSRALGFAAGSIGERIQSMLRERGVTPDFVTVSGESRINTVIMDESDGTQTTITTTTLEVDKTHVATLKAKFNQALAKATCVIMGGSLPPGLSPALYTELIATAQKRHIPVIFDADEPNLSAGLQSSPAYIKPNEHELAQVTGHTIDSVQAAYYAGKLLQEQYQTTLIITLGERGALAVLPEKAYFIPALKVDVVSAAGAGDGVLAGIAHSIVKQESIEAGIKLGIALAAAICMQPGTAEFEIKDLESLLPQVTLQPYHP